MRTQSVQVLEKNPKSVRSQEKRLNKCVLRWENESFIYIIFLYEILEGFVEKFMVAPQKPSTFCEVAPPPEFRIFGDISRLWIRRESWSRERFPPQPFAAYNPRTKNLQ